MEGRFLCFVPFKTALELFFGKDVLNQLSVLTQTLPDLRKDAKPFTGTWGDGDRHEELREFVNNNELCTRMRYFITDKRPDPVWKGAKPNGVIYALEDCDGIRPGKWARCQLAFEIKGSDCNKDPWSGMQPGQELSFVEYARITTPKSDEGRKTIGQVVSYAIAQLTSNARNFIFSVFICGKFARIIRWDRSSVIVSEAIDFTEDPHTLALFLRSYSQATDDQRGWDITVEEEQPGDRDLALRALATIGKSLGYEVQPDTSTRPDLILQEEPVKDELLGDEEHPARMEPLKGYAVPGSAAVSEVLHSNAAGATNATATKKDDTPVTKTKHVPRTFYKAWQLFHDKNQPLLRTRIPSKDGTWVTCIVTAQALHKASAAIGRGTRGYVAVGIEKMHVGWLKDTWRIDTDSISPEGETYAVLAKARMLNLPSIIACGDLIGQQTLVEELANQSWINKAVQQSLVPHQHYRLFMDFLGDNILAFESSQDMVRGVFQALKMWRFAYEDCGVLHRDISPWNILLTDEGGCLVDWELCKRYKDGKPVGGPRRGGRTGTWQFMSVRLLGYSKTYEQSSDDDLESFLWVLLWICLRYLPNSVSNDTNILQYLITSTFDSSAGGNNPERVGGDGKRLYLLGTGLLFEAFSVTNNRPLNTLLNNLRELCGRRYEIAKASTSGLGTENQGQYSGAATKQEAGQVISVEDMITEFEKALSSDGWPSGDNAKDQIPADSVDSSAYGSRQVSSRRASESTNAMRTSSGADAQPSRSRLRSVSGDAKSSFRTGSKRRREQSVVVSGTKDVKKRKIED